MLQVKKLMIERNKAICMLCGKNVGKRITFHHIRPKSHGGDDSYENGSLLCEQCHFEVVNKVRYGTRQYNELMDQIRSNKK